MRSSCFRVKNKGVTILEILIVVSLLGFLFSVILPEFSRIKENQVFKNAIEDIISTLHEAQSKSLASLDSSEYGVRFQSSNVILFKGKVFSSGASDNKTVSIVSPASISNVTLNGASGSSGDLYFDRLSGVPSKTGTVTVTSNSFSKVITISATGSVSSN